MKSCSEHKERCSASAVIFKGFVKGSISVSEPVLGHSGSHPCPEFHGRGCGYESCVPAIFIGAWTIQALIGTRVLKRDRTRALRFPLLTCVLPCSRLELFGIRVLPGSWRPLSSKTATSMRSCISSITPSLLNALSQPSCSFQSTMVLGTGIAVSYSQLVAISPCIFAEKIWG